MSEKTIELLKQLTLEEKAGLCSGINSWQTTPIKRLGIPSIRVSDGPHGVRKENGGGSSFFHDSEKATCFPTAVTLASTWNRDSVKTVGDTIAKECIDQDVDVILGPGINMKRSPLCGRNFEYFSEDPYLAGELASSYIQGVKQNHIGVSLKHFAVNSQEYRRMVSDSLVDERAMREIYLSAFERTVKQSEPDTIMASYNLINGTYASENKQLLNDILRDEWGYKGIVISDWGAVSDRINGVLAGLNIEMPTSNGIRDDDIVRAVKGGKLKVEDLDKCVLEILDFIEKCEENRKNNATKPTIDYNDNYETALRIAKDGAVLLKNQNATLPIKKWDNIAVIGELAELPRIQGTGSSKLHPYKVSSFTDVLNKHGITYEYAKGYHVTSEKPEYDEIYKACKACEDKDYVIIVAGLTEVYESEGFDRDTIDFPPAQTALIDEIAKYNQNIIVVLCGGSPVNMPWLDNAQSVLNMYLSGEAFGEAVYDLLIGQTNPSGKLPETFPLKTGDVLSTHYFGDRIAEYRESIFIGYRYFDTAKKPVLFPFGFGLSYTQFEYSNLLLSKENMKYNEELEVSVDITNVGEVAGSEVVELYVSDTESTLFREEKSLRGFEKVYLEPNETKTVKFLISERDFAFYNVIKKDWSVESGNFAILVGASSQDIKLKANVTVEGNIEDINTIPDYKMTASAYYNIDSVGDIPLTQFEAVYGNKIDNDGIIAKYKNTFNTAVGDLKGGLICSLFKWGVRKFSASMILPKDASSSEKKMINQGALDMPIRNLYAMSNGMFSYEMACGLLDMCNGRFLRGLFEILKNIGKKNVSKQDRFPF